ncbi:sodium:proton exchanger [Candidatus Woesearchaeota archaeon]|nr:sodium:proton exchanger [Candidatus Woesearchaeota archaeon]
MIDQAFIELSKIVFIVIIVAGIMKLLRQPLIIGYVFTGILAGPYVLNIVSSTTTISTFSHIGIALLLFMVGLNLNPKIIKDVGKVSLITGLGQVIFTSLVGYFILKLLGFSTIVSIYVAIALTFSSTIIITKLLSDKGDLETLYGKISVGFLIVQDLVVILILMIISAIPSGMNLIDLAVGTVLKGLGLIVFLFLLSIYVMPQLIQKIAKSQEFLLLFAIGWCLTLASLFYYLNFSMEIGALLAGITLAASPYRHEISAKMKPLRDFFIILFFILLGSQMVFVDISQYIIPIIILSLFIIIGNPLIVMILMGALNYTKRNSFLAGLTVAQISEFSLIFIALGVSVGHLSNEILSFVTVIGLVTITGSTYLILYANKIYSILSKYLKIFERKGEKVDEHKYHKENVYEIILFGCNHMGHDLIDSFKKMKKKFLVIDYDPEVVVGLAKKKIDCRYIDIGDYEALNELDFSKLKMAISTISNTDTNMMLINKIRESNKKSIIIVVSEQIDEAISLYKKGATYVLMPEFLGGSHTSAMIERHGLDVDKFLKEKVSHLTYLKNRKTLKHRHPKRRK